MKNYLKKIEKANELIDISGESKYLYTKLFNLSNKGDIDFYSEINSNENEQEEPIPKHMFIYKHEQLLEKDHQVYTIHTSDTTEGFLGMLNLTMKKDHRIADYYKTMISRVATIINLFNVGNPPKYEIVTEFYQIEYHYCQCIF